MTNCEHCGARSTLFLCVPDIDQLADMLADLPWLLSQLEITRTRQDRLSRGLVGKGADPISPINVGAFELAREARKVLAWIAGLAGGVDAELIARHQQAGEFYAAIADLCGDPNHPDSQPGRILTIINAPSRLFAGLCGTVRGHNAKGEAIECGNPLYAAEGQQTVECGRCGSEADVARLRSKSLTDRDLATEVRLLTLLADVGEPVSRVRFYDWVKAGRVQVRGYMHMGQLTPHRIRRGDPGVYSISQCRALRTQEESKEKV